MQERSLWAYSLFRVLLEHLSDKSLSLVGLQGQMEGFFLEPPIFDVVEEGKFVAVLEGKFAAEHVIEENAG